MKKLLTCTFLVQFLIVQAQEVYTSDNLIITQLTQHTYVHISYLQTESYGKVACNGMIYFNKDEAVVADSPSTELVASELIKWIRTSENKKIIAVIATHFHDDCLGGLEAFHRAEVPSYANQQTIQFAKQNNSPVPLHGFMDSLTIQTGHEDVKVFYPGPGHTSDNVVVYIPTDSVLFGGCLIKEMGATEGYTGDANLQAWSGTISDLQSALPEIRHIIPGHGKPGHQELLDYTKTLFDKYEQE